MKYFLFAKCSDGSKLVNRNPLTGIQGCIAKLRILGYTYDITSAWADVYTDDGCKIKGIAFKKDWVVEE